MAVRTAGLHRVLGVVILAAALPGCSLVRLWGEHLDKESQAFVDTAIPAVVGEWEVNELVKRGNEELRSHASREPLDDLFFAYRRLGRLTEYRGSEGAATVSLNTQEGMVVTARYLAAATFENGDATITALLVRRGGEWEIAAFHVASPVLEAGSRPSEPEAAIAEASSATLEERVGALLAGDEIHLREGVEAVFALAQVRAEEGAIDEAIRLYRRALGVDAGNLAAQLRLATLLRDAGDDKGAADKARLVQGRAEEEGLIGEAEGLLAALGEKPTPAAQPVATTPNLAITLVPLGEPTDRLLREVRDVLQERTGIAFEIADRKMALGEPDRTWAQRYLADFRERLDQHFTATQVESLRAELGLEEGDLAAEANQARLIRLALGKMGADGAEAQRQFDADLRTAREHVQYDVSRLIWALRYHMPLEPSKAHRGVLAITEQDLYDNDIGFLFGSAAPRYGVISYARFVAHAPHERQDRPRVVERTVKQALSSVMFLLGHPRCQNPTCVRAYPHSVLEHDAKPSEYCAECRQWLAAYKERVAANPQAGEAELKRGHVLWEERRLEEAAVAYREAIALSPNRLAAHYHLGSALKALGDLPGAIDAFQNAIAIEPRWYLAHRSLGVTYGAQGEYERAIRSLRTAVELKPDDPVAHNDLGYSYYRAQRLAEAIPELRRAIDLDPSLALAHYNLALTYYAAKDLAAAADHCNRAIALGYRADPRFVAAVNGNHPGAVAPGHEG